MKLKLFRPLKTQLIISQNFGENNACIKNDGTENIIPRTSANCPVGYQSIYTHFGMRGHNGLDFPAKDWTPVYASVEGIVNEISTERERGLGVGTITENKYEVKDSTTGKQGEYQIKVRYWHLAGINVKIGNKVKAGDLIGWADNTGFSTASHLHWETKAVENGINVWQNNGYFGAFDPLPYMDLKMSAFEKNDLLAKIKLQLMDIMNQIHDLLNKK